VIAPSHLVSEAPVQSWDKVLLSVLLLALGMWGAMAIRSCPTSPSSASASSNLTERERLSYELGQQQMRYALQNGSFSGKDQAMAVVLRCTEIDALNQRKGFDKAAFLRGCEDEWDYRKRMGLEP
jgi:hypothetical protein